MSLCNVPSILSGSFSGLVPTNRTVNISLRTPLYHCREIRVRNNQASTLIFVDVMLLRGCPPLLLVGYLPRTRGLNLVDHHGWHLRPLSIHPPQLEASLIIFKKDIFMIKCKRLFKRFLCI